ncbi:MAG: zincin-like metallopeptidase domain-containing protein [Planctomycetota bacterium]
MIAELSASFLCAACGISPPTIEQSAAYMQGWISVLKGDKRMVSSGSGAAQKSADPILDEPFHDNIPSAVNANLPQRNVIAQTKPSHSTSKPSQLGLF